jgi:hypothetical protein
MSDKAQQQSPPAAEREHHVADEPSDNADDTDAGVQSPTTETGLPVEDQVRKEWDPNKDGGLPAPLRAPRR